MRHDEAQNDGSGELIASLADGARVLFRPITCEDKDRLRAAFNRLSPESRYRRFFRQVDRLTERQLRYLTEADHENQWTLADNLRMLDLLKELGAVPHKWEQGVLEMTVPLPDHPRDLAATPAPLILKAVAEAPGGGGDPRSGLALEVHTQARPGLDEARAT